MWSSFVSGVSRIMVLGESSIIYRDELREKKLRKSKMCSGSLEPLMQNHDGDDEKGRVIRIKVKMTKEEAAQLLSRCKDGGVIEFKDAAQQLAQIPLNRVSVDSFVCSGDQPLVSVKNTSGG